MRQSETTTQDHRRNVDDYTPPSFRPRRWDRSKEGVAVTVEDVPNVPFKHGLWCNCMTCVLRDPAPDLDNQIEAAGEQPAP